MVTRIISRKKENALLETVINLLVALCVILQIVDQLVIYIGTLTNNKKVLTLADRAMIIVSSLDSLGIANEAKKQEALGKLTNFANEVGINLSLSQAEDYIENAVQALRRLQGEVKPNSEVSNNAPKTK